MADVQKLEFKDLEEITGGYRKEDLTPEDRAEVDALWDKWLKAYSGGELETGMKISEQMAEFAKKLEAKYGKK